MEARQGRWRRATSLYPSALLVVAVVPLLVFAGDMPDPVAVHWSLGGAPDGRLPLWGSVLVAAALVTVPWALSIAGSDKSVPTAEGAAVVGFMGGIAAGVSWVIVVANRGADTWRDASTVGALTVVFVLAAGVALGAAGWGLGSAAAPPDRRRPGDLPDVLPTAGLRPGETADWSGVTRVWWPFVLAGVGAVIAIALPAPWWGLAAVGLVLGSVLAQVRVTISGDRVVVGFGLVGLPRRTFSMDRIRAAAAVDVAPIEFGGWGYRIRKGVSAVIIRKGEALALRLDDGRRFVVTIDGAEPAAGLVNDVLRRSGRLDEASGTG